MNRFGHATRVFLILAFLVIPHVAGASAWVVDPRHTTVGFKARYLMVTWVGGYFRKVRGSANFEPGKWEKAKVEIVIEAASIDTRHERRDNHLRSADFLYAEKYPQIVFKSKRIQNAGDSGFELIGDLTIRGVTKEVVLNVEDIARLRNNRGRDILGASATVKINRKNFGLNWNRVLEAGGFLVGDNVQIAIDVQFVKRD